MMWYDTIDADPGAVHQTRVADCHDGHRTAGKGERAQPPNDGHGSRVSCGLGLLPSRHGMAWHGLAWLLLPHLISHHTTSSQLKSTLNSIQFNSTQVISSQLKSSQLIKSTLNSVHLISSQLKSSQVVSPPACVGFHSFRVDLLLSSFMSFQLAPKNVGVFYWDI